MRKEEEKEGRKWGRVGKEMPLLSLHVWSISLKDGCLVPPTVPLPQNKQGDPSFLQVLLEVQKIHYTQQEIILLTLTQLALSIPPNSALLKGIEYS